MNNAINTLCGEGTAYSPRIKTDKLFKLPAGSFVYNEYFDKTAKFVQDEYLCKAEQWKMFVEQYRSNVDDNDKGWRGEYWGKMMRGSCFTYEYTQDENLYNVLVETIEDMLSAQQPSGRFSTYSEECEFDGWDLWGRKYIFLGFQYFLDICKSDELKERVIKAMCAHADYIMERVGLEEEGKKLITKCTRSWLGLNSASILEPFVRLYNITGEKKYFDYATYIVNTGGVSEGNVFEMAYEDKIDPYQYTTNKAYEMMSCFEGLLEYYRVTGIEKYKEAVVNFAKRVMASDITIIGCSGCTHELFDNSSKTQLNTEYGGVVQETCVTVTWMKYCFQILSITADPSFADAIEISAYNAMAGAVNSYKIKDILGGFPFDSYRPLLFNARARASGGVMEMAQGIYGCCACIGSAGTALIPLSSAMLSKDGIYVNLYIPGTVKAETPSGKAVTLTVDTDYPRDGKIKITVDGADGENMKIAFRIPAYSSVSTMSVNGAESVKVGAGYEVVERNWANGDTVELEFDVRVRTYRCEGNTENSKYHVALYKGPVVLARDARLGEKIDSIVDIAEDEYGFVQAIPSSTATFETNMEYKIPMKDGTYITVIDYSSAGKTWTAESVMTAWMATKEYWKVDITKPIYISNINAGGKRSLFINEEGVLKGDLDNKPQEVWTLEAVGDGYYRIKSSDGRYLTAKGEESDSVATVEDRIECDCQVWKIEHYVQNRYSIISKKYRCHLYEKYATSSYRLYALNKDADMKYYYNALRNNIALDAPFEFINA